MSARLRFERQQRIRQPDEFVVVAKQGRRLRQQHLAAGFVVKAGRARLGLAIAKKAAPLATARNRIKRLIREEFRRSQKFLPPVDLVFYALPGAGSVDSQALREQIAKILQQVTERCGHYSRSLSGSTSSRSAP